MGERIEDVYTVEEVAKKLKCTEMTIRNYIEQGRVRMIKIGGRFMMRESELRYIVTNGLHDYSDEFRELSRKRRAVTRARAKARAEAGRGS